MGRWIYEHYDITTMINNLVGRYGLQVDGAWIPVTNYADPRTREVIKNQVRTTVERYKDTPGVLLWLLGNENNYGLHWSSFEIEALPKGDRDQARARHLYSLYGELVDLIHELDPEHPVSIANGDLQYIDLIAEEVPNLDILGTNVYRGISARDLYQEVQDKLNVPVLYSEFGADAYDAKREREDSVTQARYVLGQWQEIYEQSHGKGRVGNAIGGYTFQWADGWWKHQQEINLDIHDTTASWPNRGYPEDFVDGQNNMNEEWFGICAKGPPDADGHFEVYPRPAYYALREAYMLDAYDSQTNLATIRTHFGAIHPADFAGIYNTALMKEQVKELGRARLGGFRFEQSSFVTDDTRDNGDGRLRTEFDHMETLYVDLVGEPTEKVRAEVSLSVLGHVAQNRMDELFYESSGSPRFIQDTEDETLMVDDFNRLRLYRGTVEWDHPRFHLTGYYREGHYHWGYEGDFFGLYREAHYGPNIDIYNANVPIGVEIEAKQQLTGLKVAMGPQLYWGANPQILAKYERKFGRFDTAIVHQEDITAQTQSGTSQVIPEQVTRKSTVYAGFDVGPVRMELGGIAAGSNKVGWEFTRVVEATDGEASYANSGYHVIDDAIQPSDVFGGRVRAQAKLGAVQWFGQGGYQGLVADGGEDRVTVFTGWRLRPDGRGNQVHAQTGLTFAAGWLQIAQIFCGKTPDWPQSRFRRTLLKHGSFLSRHASQKRGGGSISGDRQPRDYRGNCSWFGTPHPGLGSGIGTTPSEKTRDWRGVWILSTDTSPPHVMRAWRLEKVEPLSSLIAHHRRRTNGMWMRRSSPIQAATFASSPAHLWATINPQVPTPDSCSATGPVRPCGGATRPQSCRSKSMTGDRLTTIESSI